ncbi:IS66 family transposase [Verminephrobacter eiseniae]|uniref:IS66 family transposase n=1 Tax=Verminephrobacter eiseniae TaxID=364317 RepID=UPI0038B27A43
MLTTEEFIALQQALAEATRRGQEMAQRNESLFGELRVTRTERDLALERLRALQHQLFAAKSEARGTEQKDMFLNEAEALAPTAQTPPAEIEDDEEEDSTPDAGKQSSKRKKRGRKPLDPALPRDIVRHELPESERICAHDGYALVEIGAEISEQMHVIPEQLRVKHHRIKYACPCCDLGLRLAPTPARIIPRGLLTDEAQAWVITGKYQFGMPLYRTAKLLSRFGGNIVSNTLAAGVVRIGLATQPVINLLRDCLLESDLIYGDETHVQVLKEPGRKAQTKSYMWAQMNGTGPPVRLFAYAPGRGAEHAQKLYAGVRRGTVLMSDGYEVYNGIAKGGCLTHLGCWVHARRPFIKAEEAIPKAARSPHQLATRFIKLIGKLYRAEARARDWAPERRQRLRARYSAAVVRAIEQLLLTNLHAVAPSSLLGQALHYLHGQWPKLIRFVDNATWPLDSNPVENSIRPFVVGRKGWLFADTVGGANASANLYSLVETCKANGIEPYRYLVALFKKLPLAQTADDYEALLPWNIDLAAA